MRIEITGLKPHQEKQIERLLAEIEWMCNVGRSRYVHLWIDGDGAPQPNINIDGHSASREVGKGKWRDKTDDDFKHEHDGFFISLD